jgi:hypothetical protein
MSLLYHEKADLEHRDYGIVLALVCLALGLVVAGLISTPEAVVAGINSESLFVGP